MDLCMCMSASLQSTDTHHYAGTEKYQLKCAKKMWSIYSLVENVLIISVAAVEGKSASFFREHLLESP